MATRSNLRPNPVIVNGDMSADIASKPTILQSLTICSYSYSWAGAAPVGTVIIEESNDYSLDNEGNVKNAGNWVQIPIVYNGSTVQSVPLSGNSGAGILEGTSGAYAIRTRYIFTSGTGTLQTIFVGKVT